MHTAIEISRSKAPLPSSLAPRGLSRAAAAAYVGISPNTFDRMVRDALMPKPIRVYGRVLWDRMKLDEAFSALSDGDEADETGEADTWRIRP
jgi:predicted DNA-binding transcriptional regulator AlpA